jgi:hypothetical protein
VRRDTLATHLQAIYAMRPTERVDVAFAAGPSFFRVRQAIVDDVSYNDAYPYDSPVFIASTTSRVSGHKTGFNASADAAMRLSRRVGIGGLVRFSNADVRFAVPNGSAPISSKAGGLQVAGGVRLFF